MESELAILDALERVIAAPPSRRDAVIDELPELTPSQRERVRRMAAQAVEQDALDEQHAELDARPVRPIPNEGYVLGDFTLIESLGCGGMGRVWSAHQASMDRVVALKILHGGGARDAVAQLTREAAAAGSIRHPGIINIHAAGEVDGIPYVAMERIEGDRTLSSWCTEQDLTGRGPAHVRRAAQLASDIAAALSAAHEAGIVHRDLKPTNIMLRDDGAPVIVDFGLSGFVDATRRGTITRSHAGSENYMAPEQFEQNAALKDTRTDVYQLGATIYELVTLRRAFGDSHGPGLSRRVMEGDFPRPRAIASDIPRELEAIVLKAMHLSPSQRYASACELRDDLRRFLDGVETPHAARGGPLVMWMRRAPYALRRHRTAAAALVTLTAGLSLGAWSWRSGATAPRAEAFKLTADEQAVVLLNDDDTVSRGDIIGAVINIDRPTTVYALSTFGERSPLRWVMPRHPHTAEMLEAAYAGHDVPEIVTLPPGRHELTLAQIDTLHEDVPCEGFIIYLADEPSPVIEKWFARLERSAESSMARQETGQTGVRYDRALAHLDDITQPTRGGSIELTPEQLERVRALRAVDFAADDLPKLPGVTIHRATWNVHHAP